MSGFVAGRAPPPDSSNSCDSNTITLIMELWEIPLQNVPYFMLVTGFLQWDKDFRCLFIGLVAF